MELITLLIVIATAIALRARAGRKIGKAQFFRLVVILICVALTLRAVIFVIGG